MTCEANPVRTGISLIRRYNWQMTRFRTKAVEAHLRPQIESSF
jgi:hypothetical protein